VSAEEAVLLLGRRDEPTDGVADYCEKLREAAIASGIRFEVARVHWAEKGWSAALAELRRAAADWQGRWVLMQYTTLAWSRRGFPLRASRVLDLLRRRGARPGVVFHDFLPAQGAGIVARARAFSQLRVLRQLYARSNLAVFTVPVDKIAWLPSRQDKAVFIPVGSNFPELPSSIRNHDAAPASVSTVAVFGITGGAVGAEEVSDVAYAVKFVQSRGIPVRLLALGRGTSVFENELRNALDGSGVNLSVLGLLSAEEFVQALTGAQVLLCIRGHVSSRRGSAIAGITCGLPIVGYRGAETGFPITEAGVRLVDQRNRKELAQALAEVLADEALHRQLCQQSAAAARKYFSWNAIASRFAEAMSGR